MQGNNSEYLKSFQSFTQSIEKFLAIERGFLKIKQYTTKFQGLIQASLEGLAQAEEILDGNLELSEAEKQKILEQIGEASGRNNELPRRKRTGYQNQKRVNCSSLCNWRYLLP